MKNSSLLVSEIFGPTCQGEGPSIGRQCVFLRLGGCNQHCHWCLAEGQQVLMADWTWKSVQDVVEEDVVMGVSRPFHGAHLKYCPSKVLKVHDNGTQEVVRISSGSQQLVCTPSHKVLTHAYREHWHKAENVEGKELYILPKPCGESVGYKRGWMRGYLKGDGCFHLYKGRWLRLKVASIDQNLLDRLSKFALEVGVELRSVIHSGGPDSSNAMSVLELTKRQDAEALYEYISTSKQDICELLGFLGGIFDAEGNVNGGEVRISQSRVANPEIVEEIRSCLEQCGFSFSEQELASGMNVFVVNEGAAFFTKCAPASKRKYPSEIGLKRAYKDVVDRVEPFGSSRVFDLTTQTGNYVSEGFVVHNCDTPYTWRFSDAHPHDWDIVYDKSKELSAMTFAEIDLALWNLTGGRDIMLVVSGGEPMLQAEQLYVFLNQTSGSGLSRIEIETAGTLWHEGLGNSANVHFNVSPKLQSSGNPKELRFQPEVLDKFAMAGHAIFKFVVTELLDFNEIEEIIALTMIRKDQVYIMPEGSSRETFIESQQRVAQVAIDKGYNLTTRLHILLWDKKRGV